MSSPLISRPAYGTRTPLAVAELPEGPPADKGISLPEGVSGYKTFAKPVDDKVDTPNKDESIYRVESPRDLTKDQGQRDEIDHSEAKPHYMGLGKPDENSPKTKYPYRDGIPNAHNAQVIANLWLLQQAPERRVSSVEGRTAAKMDDMLRGLNPKFLERSHGCSVTLKRADIPNLRWIFSVDCGKGPRMVRLKATRKGSATKLAKLDIYVACSCPAWRWQGPEYHADTKQYQDPNTALQGTASTPDIRDPNRENKICKHVASVLELTYRWNVPPPKPK